jgi:hypothetical protein
MDIVSGRWLIRQKIAQNSNCGIFNLTAQVFCKIVTRNVPNVSQNESVTHN